MNKAVDSLVYLDKEHPYGSWKDMKYILLYLKNKYNKVCETSKVNKLPLFNYIITMMVKQLKIDFSMKIRHYLLDGLLKNLKSLVG